MESKVRNIRSRPKTAIRVNHGIIIVSHSKVRSDKSNGDA